MELIKNSSENLREIIAEAVAIAISKQVQQGNALLSRKATSNRLKVDYSTLWRWEKTGYLKPVRIGRAVYYKVSDIEARERGEVVF